VLLATFPAATAVFALFGVIYFAAAHRLSTAVAYRTGTGRASAHAEQMEVAQQLFSGIRDLRAFQVESHWLSEFDKANQLYRRLYTRWLIWLALPRNVMELAAVLLLLGVIAFGRLTRADSFALWLPALGLFAVATMQLMPALTAVGRMFMEIQEAKPDVERLHGVMTEGQPSPREGTRAFAGLKSEITFDRLSFRYEGRQEVLHDLSLTLPQGRVTAISGESGVGKTTIVNLLLGLIEPTAGTITVDGAPLQSYESDSAERGFRTRTSYRLRASRTRRNSSTTCPRATIPWLETEVQSCPGDNSSASPSRGRCWGIRAS
jgi:ABC-type multidrug transport system fused ATPase/permease subunit